MRDRRFDWLYERQKQPLRQYILEQFAARLAEELRAWPPADLEWEGEAARAAFAHGAAARPREQVVRFALQVARLDLRRDFEGVDRLLEAEGAHHWQTAEERAAGHLLLRLVTEACLELKERAHAARLTREELVGAVDLVERALFAVTAG